MAFQKIKTSLSNLHHKTPEPVRKLYAPFFKWRYSKQYINRFHTYLPLTLYTGPAREGPGPLTIAYAGQDQETALHWVNKILSEYTTESLGRHWIWRMRGLLAKHPSAPALFLIEKKFLTNIVPSLRPGLTIPYWIQSTIDISTPIDKIPRRQRRGFNDAMRRIRKFDLTYTVTRDPKDIEHFYQTMHVPFINNRYEAEAVFLGKKRLQKSFNRSDLILIKKDGEVLGGDTLEHTPQGAVLRLIGVKDGNIEYLRYGIIGALYYFALQEAHKKGYTSVNVGGTSPFLSDGLTRFKGYLNARVIPHTYLPKKCVQVMFLNNSEALKNFFIKNPLVYYPKRFQPHRALFISDEHVADPRLFKDIYTSNTFGGIKKHDIFVFSKDKDVPKKVRWPDMPIGSVRALTDYFPQ